MNLKLVSAFVLLSFSLGQSALANFPGAPPAIVPPSHMYGATIAPGQTAPGAHLMGPDHQFFEFNVSGMRDYLDSIKEIQPRLYAEVLPELERLERQRTMGRLVIGGGVVVAVIGAASFLSSIPGPDSSNFGANGPGSVAKAASLYITGIGIAAVGYFFVLPDRKDLLKFLNKHNSVSPERAIRLQLGLAPAPRGGMLAGLQLQF